ncbi:bacillithiol biosynthesis cysteine-adding enzyme BshC [Neobacillus sp. PS3-34]|uniref:bacillithiol biosynthesis cysteine-adding enzyme BshC n=1 Tax=Neobacillus sp. PS3-34 TaxID=3070678 RepID=UPI0027E19C5B|nr:bacillithiol biosynthesis cysteine-adding enzyme BshC [Neobacillus sp. PS3-34]WML49349.1 bacillithiol biosynthesis cysteine-adding enzyme BshC [Neobacillus sp. PS3-34]
MEMLNLSLPATNRFASSYLEQSDEILPFFHYRFDQKSDYQERLNELKNRSFPRNEVAEHIEDYMSKFPSSSAVKESIAKLREHNSAVIIGGQQAGILTGPLYTIHKVISILKLSEQKEKELGIPVVPVFWIAGEDHDYHEVNHVYVPVEKRADKWTYPERVLQKKMVTDIPLDREVCLSWAKNLIENFGETDHTNSLIEFIEQSLSRAASFTDFFAAIIMELFKDEGLLIVDSGNKELRHIEKSIFEQQITHHDVITFSLLEQQKEINEKGYSLTIEAGENSANLFFYEPELNERILLEFDRNKDMFVGKNGAISFSKEELLEIALHQPEKLSNNVVTRPLTQDLLFPTLGFIAGPGEIAYWAELKKVFEHFAIKMPPIVPRLNITLLDRSIETDLQDLQLDIKEVLSRGTSVERESFLESIKDKELEELFSDTREKLIQQYREIEDKTAQMDRGLLPLLKKNEEILIQQIGFMESRIEDSIRRKHDVILSKFTRIDLALRPEGSPQERIWNVFDYMNLYGLDLIRDLLTLPFKFDGQHKVIKL